MASDGMKFAIKRSRWWRPLLALFGGTEAHSYVTINEQGLVARFGFYRIALPHEQIASVEPRKWPWYGGLGWRTNFKDTIALIGSHDGVVQIKLKEPLRAHVLRIPVKMVNFYISVENPGGFIAAMQAAL
jgi:hypothetical protein